MTMLLAAKSPEVFEVDYRCQVTLSSPPDTQDVYNDEVGGRAEHFLFLSFSVFRKLSSSAVVQDALSTAESEVLASHGVLPPMETAKLRQKLEHQRAKAPPRESVIGRMTVSLSQKRRAPLAKTREKENTDADTTAERTTARRDSTHPDDDHENLLDALLASSSTDMFVRVSAVVLPPYHLAALSQKPQRPSSLMISVVSRGDHPLHSHILREWQKPGHGCDYVKLILHDIFADLFQDQDVHDAIRSAPYMVSQSFASLLSSSAADGRLQAQTGERDEREKAKTAEAGKVREAETTQAFVASAIEAALVTAVEELSADPGQIQAG